jgi:hypothetical protein
VFLLMIDLKGMWRSSDRTKRALSCSRGFVREQTRTMVGVAV